MQPLTHHARALALLIFRRLLNRQTMDIHQVTFKPARVTAANPEPHPRPARQLIRAAATDDRDGFRTFLDSSGKWIAVLPIADIQSTQIIPTPTAPNPTNEQ